MEGLGPVVAIDLETTGLDVFKDKILDVIVATSESEYFRLGPDELPELLKIPKDTTLVFHNFRYDVNILYRNGIDLRGYNIRDTMLLHHLIDENKSHALGEIIKEEYQDFYKDEFWGKHKTYQEATPEEQIAYASKDCLYTYELYFKFLRRLEEQGIPYSLIEHVHRLAHSLFVTELQGVKVDLEYITDLGVRLKTSINELLVLMKENTKGDIELLELHYWSKELDKRKTIKGRSKVPKPEFCFDSSKQLADLLYNQLRLPIQKNEKTKSISTDDKSLEALVGKHPLIDHLRQYREKNKVYTTYVEGILERANGNRIYPSFNINGTKTGRISHTNPNMGNIPADSIVRGMFVPDSGRVLISADYAQLEICLAAHFSQDKNLLRIVFEGLSQHDITSQELGIPRDKAKTLNFAMQYRCSHFKVASILGVPEDQAMKIWKKYWETYSGLKRLMDTCDKKIDLGQPITSPFGRQRHFERQRRNAWDKAYRQGYNALIQGTGGDLTNRACYLVSDALRASGAGRVLFTVHDEILLEVCDSNDTVDSSNQLLDNCMVGVGKEIKLTVPLTVNISKPMLRWSK